MFIVNTWIDKPAYFYIISNKFNTSRKKNPDNPFSSYLRRTFDSTFYLNSVIRTCFLCAFCAIELWQPFYSACYYDFSAQEVFNMGSSCTWTNDTASRSGQKCFPTQEAKPQAVFKRSDHPSGSGQLQFPQTWREEIPGLGDPDDKHNPRLWCKTNPTWAGL